MENEGKATKGNPKERYVLNEQFHCMCVPTQPSSRNHYKHLNMTRISFLITTNELKLNNSSTCCLALVFSQAVPIIPAMTSILKVFPLIFISLGFATVSCGQNQAISDAVKRIFLSKNFNSNESEWILNSGRESFLFLKDVEKKSDVNEKLNFVKNYANFLLKLFNELQTKDFDIYELFSKENSFLKGYNSSQTAPDFNITELRTKIEDLQFAVEQHLIVHYNSSNECFEAHKLLALNKTSFDAFMKEKFRADISTIGYFFLEVFATVIGFSWGIISAVAYYGNMQTMYPIH